MRLARQLLVAFALAATAAGCELIVHIDPASIPGMGTGGTGGGTGGTGGVGGKTSSSASSSGTGGTGGASSASSSSGTGGGCATAADCPPATGVCASAACDPTAHTCSIVEVAVGDLAADSAQVAGDCKKVVCDGKGTPMSANDDTDVPDDGEVCTTDSCNAGVPVHAPNTLDCSENMGKVCGDPAGLKPGKCVACNIDSDCGAGICQLNHCVTSSCNDIKLDGDETDVDCGGSCAPCADHLVCKVNGDCQSDICSTSNHTCTPASCSDGVENQNETDTDCGGKICRPQGKLCATGKGCAVAGDCQSLNCDTVAHACKAPTCLDGIQNQGETDTDCGGPNCGGCANGLKCQVDGDCASKGCSTTTALCAPQCSDAHRDGVETDTDCGGPNTCPRCPLTKACLGDSDCASNACDGVSLVCDADQCADRRQDGVETDTDCGGGTCATCPNGKKCLVDSDCASTGCQSVSLLCVAPCTDLHKDGVETDVDCGGANTCPRCAMTRACLIDADCASNACQTTMLVCVTPCTDGHVDGAETDVDCGGGTCGKCPTGKGCQVDADCTSAACDGVSFHCVADQCNDHRTDGVETDKDCGGPNLCPRCGLGALCAQNSDCLSNACDAGTGTCVADQCSDHHQDGVETDKDCGGGICPTCANTKGCVLDTDCTSNACDGMSLKCVADQCSDHRQDGAETDQDCGGGTCTACGLTQKCLIDTDCNSNACDGLSFLCVANQCNDHRQDGAETAADCGGGTCIACGLGLGCLVDTDCSTNACDGLSHLCVADPCNDHRQDGAETAVDCGGATCPKCANGLACLVDTDCTSNACDGVSHLCVADQCNDHRQDGAETAADCGGGTCGKCANGLACLVDTDCTSNACDGVSHLCVADQCNDHRQDGAETAADCGGGTCGKCANGLACVVDTDCTSGACDGMSHLCVADQCADHRQDGLETAVDCGGGTCSPCADGLGCAVDSDCVSTACDFVTMTCDTSQCIDKQQDGAETDIDCGGGTCLPCGLGLKCVLDSDCATSACDASLPHLCLGDQCADHHQNGTETDADCGGSCSPCATGLKCLIDADCTSSACDGVSHLCVNDQCADNRQDGLETDTDCGGANTCPRCANGSACNTGTDCASGSCNGSSKCIP